MPPGSPVLHAPVRLLSLVLLVALPLSPGRAQAPDSTEAVESSAVTGSPAPADAADPVADSFPDQPYVVERARTTYRFREDGTGRRVFRARIRLQSEAGVQALGQLAFPYSAAFEELTVDHVRIVKPDGREVEAGEEHLHDRSSVVGARAPVYSDARLVHVSVPALRPGDVLEVKVTKRRVEPVVPGHFTVEDVFWTGAPVLKEVIEVDAPAGRELHVGGGEDGPDVSRNGDRRVYRWTHRVLDPEATDASSVRDIVTRARRRPDVLASTFSDWRAMASWYASTASPSESPTERIRALGDSLAAGLASDRAVARALYRYVAQEIRYVAVHLGAARYRPHPAADVLRNGYGDCKDKHALLASLLRSQGLEARPALIHSVRDELVEGVPTRGQFDHVVTVLELDGERIWLDATTGVGPFAYLPANLRGKRALVAKEGPSGGLVRTPEEPAVPNREVLDVRGRVHPDGRLVARFRLEVRGDPGVVMRTVFRRVPRARREEAVGRILGSTGVPGEVVELEISDVGATSEPLVLEARLEEEGWVAVDSGAAAVSPPLPAPQLPEAGDGEDDEAPRLGGPMTVRYRAALRVPEGATLDLPEAVSLERPWARYESSFAASGDSLVAERRLRLLAERVPSEQRSSYRTFRERAREDADRTFRIVTAASGGKTAAADSAGGGPADPNVLFNAGRGYFDDGQFERAEEVLRRVVEIDPDHPDAWNALGRSHASQGDDAAAVEAFRRQVEVAPRHRWAWANIGLALWRLGHPEEAEEALRRQLEVRPDSHVAAGTLGQVLLAEGEPAAAERWIRKALELRPEWREMKVQLSRAVQKQGRTEEAEELFNEAMPELSGRDVSDGPGTPAADPSGADPSGEAAGSGEGAPAGGLQALVAEGRDAEAVALIRRRVVQTPRTDMQPYGLARRLVTQAPAAKVREVLEAAVEASPDDAILRETLACLLLYTADPEAALEHARAATRADPEDAFGWLVRGRAEYRNLNDQRAQSAYRRSDAIDPRVLEASPQDLRIWQQLEGG